MNITLFSQLLQELSRKEFRKSVALYQTDKHNKGINSWTHLVTMLFLHLTKANCNQWTKINYWQPQSSWDRKENTKQIITILYQ